MKKLIVLLIPFFIAVHINAQSIYKSNEGEVSFFSETPVENIEAHNKNISSLINTASKDIVFIIPIRSFKFSRSLMQEHFNEKYMESDKYPDATFKGKINEDIDFTKDGEYKVTSSGVMTVHGVEKQVTHSGTLTIKNSTISLKSDFDIALKDYNITVPKLVIKNIAEVVPVKLQVNYLPYKK